MSDTNDLMDFISASLGTALEKIYQNLLNCNFGLDDPELAMFTVTLLNAMVREAHRSSFDVRRNRLMRWRRGEMSDLDLTREPGLGK